MNDRNEATSLREALLNELDAAGAITKSRLRNLLINHPEAGPAGYIVMDSNTKALDWDGELHATRDAAIESLTGQYQQWCKSVEEETDERMYWGKAYTICAVVEGAL